MSGNRPTGAPPGASRRMNEIDQRIGNRDLALFLDYDGTLTPIVDRPEQALLAETTRRLLERLNHLCPVAVVSGRDREDVAGLVGLKELIYAGSHGFDISGPEGLRMQHAAARDVLPELDRAEVKLRERLTHLDGISVERKAFAIAVHYRRARRQQDVERARSIVRAVDAECRSLCRTEGKKIVELRPDVAWDKGRAVEYLMRALAVDPARTVPLYLGDDTTDEDAFAFLKQDGIGIGILVGPPARPSEAAYYLEDPYAARRFLRRMLEKLKERGPA